MSTFIYYHDLDPFIFRFGESFGLRWYGMAYLLGFLAAFFILLFRSKTGRLKMDADQLVDLTLITALWSIAGARIGYVFLYGFSFLQQDPFYLFYFWEGGMSFHGGLLGAAVGLLWFAHSRKISFWHLTDAAALATPPGIMFGRIANFINGELWGRPTSGDWGVVFPGVDALPRHPSQLYQALLEGPLLFLLLLVIDKKKKGQDGFVVMGFLFFYAVIRFFVEFTRAPDPHIGYELLGLTRGQIYSLVLLVVPVLLTIYFLRSRNPE